MMMMVMMSNAADDERVEFDALLSLYDDDGYDG